MFKSYTKIFASGFALALLSMPLIFSACKGSAEKSEGQDEDVAFEDTIEIDEAFKSDDVAIKKIDFDTPAYDKASDTYSLKLKPKVDNAGKNPKVTYKLVLRGEKDTITSETGEYAQLKPLESSRAYMITAYCNGAMPVTIEIGSEAMPVIPKMDKMAPAELEKQLNDQSMPLVAYHEMITPVYTVEYTNLPANTKNTPDIAKIYEYILMEDWQGVKVERLEYDEYNRINKMVLTIKF